MFGYHGHYLHVDLSTLAVRRVPLPERVLRDYLGGSGLGTWLLLEFNAPACDPLGPDAPLVFAFSPLVGSPLTTSAKFAVVSKSPLTERINDSLASSGFALAGKKCGVDAIVITGAAPRPSVLVLDDGALRLIDAGDAWGATIPIAERQIRERLPRETGAHDYQLAVIGPAGERLVRYATISHDGRHAGRGGSGAVLGAKNIKAIALRGTQRCDWAAPAELTEFARRLSAASFGPATAKYRELGTAGNLLVFNRLGTLPTRNFQHGSFEHAAALSPETMSVAREKTRASCAACTIGCEHIYGLRRSDDPAGGTGGGVRLEYENLFALGPLCGVGDADAVLAASRRCDELGLDTISAGGTIAFAMECAERGFLDADWLRFGDGDALLRAIDLAAARDGELGELLSQGSRRMALALGHDSLAFAPQVKGLEIPGYEPRSLQTMALGFAVGTRGADHNRSGAYEVDFSDRVDRLAVDLAAVPLAVETEDKAALIDSLILCKFLRGVFGDLFAESATMLRLVTGWNVTAAELRTTARRIIDAKKRFNIAAGWQPAEDTLPDRFFTERLPEDARAILSRDRLATLIAAYHAHRGWTPEGFLENEEPAKLPSPPRTPTPFPPTPCPPSAT